MPTSYASSTATVDRLWEVCSDVSRWPRHLDTFASVEPLDAGPTRAGSRFAVSQPGLPRASYEVTVWRPGEGFTWVAKSPGVHTTATHEVTPTPTGSQIVLGVSWSGPMAWLVRWSMARKAQRMIESEASTLATLAEQPDRAGGE